MNTRTNSSTCPLGYVLLFFYLRVVTGLEGER